MTEINRLGCALLLAGIAGLTAYSQEKESEYVAPSEAIPRARRLRCRFDC